MLLPLTRPCNREFIPINSIKLTDIYLNRTHQNNYGKKSPSYSNQILYHKSLLKFDLVPQLHTPLNTTRSFGSCSSFIVLVIISVLQPHSRQCTRLPVHSQNRSNQGTARSSNLEFGNTLLI